MTYFTGLLIAMALCMLHVLAVTYSLRKFHQVPPIFIHFCSGIVNFILLLILALVTREFNLWFAIGVLAFGVSGIFICFWRNL